MAKTSPAKLVRQVRAEISRITWATRRDTLMSTVTVLVMVIIASIFFFVAGRTSRYILSLITAFMLNTVLVRYLNLLLPSKRKE